MFLIGFSVGSHVVGIGGSFCLKVNMGSKLGGNSLWPLLGSHIYEWNCKRRRTSQEVGKERSYLVDQVHHTAIRATHLHSAIRAELKPPIYSPETYLSAQVPRPVISAARCWMVFYFNLFLKACVKAWLFSIKLIVASVTTTTVHHLYVTVEREKTFQSLISPVDSLIPVLLPFFSSLCTSLRTVPYNIVL